MAFGEETFGTITGFIVLVNTIFLTLLMTYSVIWILYEYNYLDQQWGDIFLYRFLDALEDINYYNIITDFIKIPFEQIKFILTQVDPEDEYFHILYILTAYPGLYLVML